jgi:hypothetical protein
MQLPRHGLQLLQLEGAVGAAAPPRAPGVKVWKVAQCVGAGCPADAGEIAGRRRMQPNIRCKELGRQTVCGVE